MGGLRRGGLLPCMWRNEEGPAEMPGLFHGRQKVRPENRDGRCGTPGRTQSIS